MDRPAREFAESPGSRPRGSGICSFSTNGTHIERNELDLYGLGPGPQFTSNSVFSRDASIMVMQHGTFRTSKKIALYDVATGKLRLKKRPLARGVG